MEETERAYWVMLTALEVIGARRFGRLLALAPTLQDFRALSASKLVANGFNEKVAGGIVEQGKQLEPEQLWHQMTAAGVSAITQHDAEYPELLANIPDAPPVLFVRGVLPSKMILPLAVVGCRKLTEYGAYVTTNLVTELVRAGIVVVSGAAYGIDHMAHEAALTANGVTVAVLGTGLDWPSVGSYTKRQLLEEIVANGGAVVSEFVCGTVGQPWHFPLRNRIIAGLSRGVVVTEAGEHSGALITARLALDYNRDVGAVPGPITSVQSVGCNQLIAQGARIITTAADVLDQFSMTVPIATTLPPPLPTDPIAAKIVQCLGDNSCVVDEIILRTGLDSATVNSNLLRLELDGLVHNLGGRRYRRA